ncbi:MAG: hypothetical protein IKX31_01670 [Muribaculaceae bacterium]|nr:hypothetical protein [Muribaculaceae bacterium]
MKKVVFYILCIVVALAVSLVFYVRANEPDVPDNSVIAHAGGNIDSLTYTNSREAVEHAIACGVKYIELDVVISPEGEPLAFHSSDDMIDTVYSCDPPHIGEFISAPLRGKNGKSYTPLTWREINEIFLAHPDITFVVDKTDDPAVLEKYFPKLKKRMVVECFSLERYKEITHAGFKQAMLSEEAVSPVTVIWQDVKHLFNSNEPRVDMVAIGRDTYNSDRKMRWFIKLCNLPMAMWSATDQNRAKEMFDKIPNLWMVYTNELGR